MFNKKSVGISEVGSLMIKERCREDARPEGRRRSNYLQKLLAVLVKFLQMCKKTRFVLTASAG